MIHPPAMNVVSALRDPEYLTELKSDVLLCIAEMANNELSRRAWEKVESVEEESGWESERCRHYKGLFDELAKHGSAYLLTAKNLLSFPRL